MTDSKEEIDRVNKIIYEGNVSELSEKDKEILDRNPPTMDTGYYIKQKVDNKITETITEEKYLLENAKTHGFKNEDSKEVLTNISNDIIEPIENIEEQVDLLVNKQREWEAKMIKRNIEKKIKTKDNVNMKKKEDNPTKPFNNDNDEYCKLGESHSAAGKIDGKWVYENEEISILDASGMEDHKTLFTTFEQLQKEQQVKLIVDTNEEISILDASGMEDQNRQKEWKEKIFKRNIEKKEQEKSREITEITEITKLKPIQTKTEDVQKSIKIETKEDKTKTEDVQKSIKIETKEDKKLRMQSLINASKSEAVDLSFLLNIFDGVLETPGRIIIMTANYPERLDKALIRPGRIDMILRFDKCSSKTIARMINHFYDEKVTKNELMFASDKFTPAEVNQILFKHQKDPDRAIEELSIQNMRENK